MLVFGCGVIDLGPLITQRYRLDETGDALGFWDRNPTEVTTILVHKEGA